MFRSRTTARPGGTSGARRPSIPLVVSASAAFLVGLDTTALTVALPAIGRDLGASLATVQGVVTVFALASAALLTAAGLLADRHGPRRVFLAGVLAFGGASAVCALAPSGAWLLVAGGAQGAATAVVTAAGLAVLAAGYTGRDRDRALGNFGALAGLSFVVGPLAGGALTEIAGWRAVFLVNVPVAALIAALAWRGLPESPRRGSPPLDVPGLAAFSLGLAALNYALLQGDGHGGSTLPVLAASVVAVAALAGFVLRERRTPSPAVDLRLLRHRGFAGATLAVGLAGAGFFGLLTYLGLFLQDVLGYPAVVAGLAFLPVIVPFVLASKVAGSLLAAGRVRHVSLAVTGLVAAGVGMALLVTTDGAGTLIDFVPGLTLAGLGAGLFNPPLTSAALAALPPDRIGVGSGLLSTVRPVAVLMGTAVLGIALRAGTAHGSDLHGAALTAAQAGDVDRAAVLAGVERPVAAAAFADGFHVAALVSAALVLVAACLVAVLLRGRTPRRTLPA